MILCAALSFAVLAALYALAGSRGRERELSARLADRDQELVRTREERSEGERRVREEHAAALQAQERETQLVRAALVQAREERAAALAQVSAMEEKFGALSKEVLDANTAQLKLFTEQFWIRAQESNRVEAEQRERTVAELVRPVRDSLERVDEKTARLEERIQGVTEAGERLRTEASRLVNALRAPAQRGRWGEQQLRNTIELAGLRDHVDFLEQPVVQTADGTLRPDIAIKLPGNKVVLVDAKVPFEAFARALEADEAARPALLGQHAAQLRAHITQLSRKQYWQAFENSPEMIVLFLPGEGFLGAALDVDPLLHEDAFKERVVLATPSTLLALLLTVAHGWKQDAIAANAREIANEGRELHKRIGGLAAHFAKLGKSLDGAVKTYNEAVGSLERRLIPAARKFEELRAAAVDVEIEALPVVEARPRLPAAELAADEAN